MSGKITKQELSESLNTELNKIDNLSTEFNEHKGANAFFIVTALY